MKRLIGAVLVCSLLCGRAAAVDLGLSSPSVLLMEKETGNILYASGEHEQREPASVTKVMTLLLVMETIDAGALAYEDTVTGSAHASSMGGSQIWLKEGEQMSVEELLKAVCIVSGNDASVALAEHIAGSEEAFVERMNARAAELGMQDTHFVNCTGLPADGHLTSAHDIALMSRELILKHPDIRRFTTVWMDTLRGGESELVNTNKLVRFYEGTTGLKTGSTDAAGYCLSATAEKNGMELIAVVLKGESSDKRFEDAKAMLNYGFSTYTLLCIVPEEILPAVPVTLGERPAVQSVLTEENKLLIEKTKAQGLSQSLTMKEKLAAPVVAGDQIGELKISNAEGQTIAVLPVLAGEDVGHISFWQLAGRVLKAGFCGV